MKTRAEGGKRTLSFLKVIMSAYNNTSNNPLGFVADLLNKKPSYSSYNKHFQPFTFYLAKPSVCSLKVTDYKNQPMLHIVKGKGFIALHMHEFEDFINCAKQIKDKMIECRNVCEIHNNNEGCMEDEDNYCVLPTKRLKRIKFSSSKKKKLKVNLPEEEDDDTLPLADSS